MQIQVCGSTLTAQARSLVASGRWELAFKYLTDSLEGIGKEHVNSILSGVNKLTGINEVNLVEDNVVNNSWLDEQYSVYFENIVKIENKYYKAYKYLDRLCAEDVDKVMKQYNFYSLPVNVGGEDYTYAFSALRARTYVKKIDDQVIFSEKHHSWVFLEKVDLKYPDWLNREQLSDILDIQLKNDFGIKYKDINELQRLIISLFENQKETNNFKTTRNNEQNEVVQNYLDDQKEAENFEYNIEDYKAKIESQANEKGGWLTLRDSKTRQSYKVPRNPFLRWCLINNPAYDLIDWNCVCPRGVKTGMDDRNHTDWFIFTGLDYKKSYQYEKENRFFGLMRTKYVMELTNFQFAILAKGTKSDIFKGEVVHINSPTEIDKIKHRSIVIIPESNPDYEKIAHKAVEKSSMLITEIGGSGSHLSIVGREFGFTLIQVENAKQKIPEGAKCKVDFENGDIEIEDKPIEEVQRAKETGDIYK